VSYVNYINNKSSLYRSSAATAKLTKPTLPSKPANLNFGRRDDAEAPVLPAKKSSLSSPSGVDKKPAASVAATKAPAVDPADLEDGMKAISKDSLKNIRQSGATYSFSFQSENSAKNQNSGKGYLPASKQVGVIKPLTREAESPKKEEKEVIVLKKEERDTELPASFLRPLKRTSPEAAKKVAKSVATETPSSFLPKTSQSSQSSQSASWVTVGSALGSDVRPDLDADPVPRLPADPPPVPATRNVRFSTDGQVENTNSSLLPGLGT
jgi:hypothetical protein